VTDEAAEMRKLAESIAQDISVMATESKWTTRFVWAAIVQGALSAAVTGFLILGELGFMNPPISLIITGTVPGVWIAIGYLAYLVTGVVGMAVTALFYQYLEVNLKSLYKGAAKTIAWLHLILSNIGVIGASWTVMYAGYLGGIAGLPPAFGGQGLSVQQVETLIRADFLLPIVIFAGLSVLGIIFGGLGYILVYRARPKRTV
jgi:hypothetical protein